MLQHQRKVLTIFTSKLHRRCSTGFWILFWEMYLHWRYDKSNGVTANQTKLTVLSFVFVCRRFSGNKYNNNAWKTKRTYFIFLCPKNHILNIYSVIHHLITSFTYYSFIFILYVIRKDSVVFILSSFKNATPM